MPFYTPPTDTVLHLYPMTYRKILSTAKEKKNYGHLTMDGQVTGSITAFQPDSYSVDEW